MNLKNSLTKVRNKTAHIRTSLGFALLMAMATMPVFAQDDVDTASIIAKWAVYSAAAITLIIGFAGVLWAIRGASLLKPKN